MKRNYFQIEGDGMVGIGYNRKPCREALRKSQIVTTTYFSWLDIDILLLILNDGVLDAKDLQQFMRFFLPDSGISLQNHLKEYAPWQHKLLSFYNNLLKTKYVNLFKACCEDRLSRIHYCSIPTSDHYDGTSYETKLTSLKAMLNAPFLELFAFANHHLCECCRKAFANNWSAIDGKYQYDAVYRDAVVPLCSGCGEHLTFQDKMTEREVDMRRIKLYPNYAYRWVSETKLRQLLGFKKSFNLEAYLKDTPIRLKHFNSRKSTKCYYLLKDMLPHILPKFIVERPIQTNFVCGSC